MRRKGYATDAKLLMMKYAFFERGLERICDYVLDDNVGSRKLHEKVGYVQEGVLRKAHFVDGVFHDDIIYGCVKEDFLRMAKEYEL
ncbi:MAG: GNAT family protein [Bacteroidales bacterium]